MSMYQMLSVGSKNNYSLNGPITQSMYQCSNMFPLCKQYTRILYISHITYSHKHDWCFKSVNLGSKPDVQWTPYDSCTSIEIPSTWSPSHWFVQVTPNIVIYCYKKRNTFFFFSTRQLDYLKQSQCSIYFWRTSNNKQDVYCIINQCQQ